MVLWAICTTCLGLCKTPGQLIAVRFLLGLFEGGLFVSWTHTYCHHAQLIPLPKPGLNFIFSLYFTRAELGKRTAIFFAGATLAGAFGGLLGR